jgi:hypothetical protein
MVYTAAPPDYCDNDVEVIVQHALSGVNSLEKERLDNAEGKNPSLRTSSELLSHHNSLMRSLS